MSNNTDQPLRDEALKLYPDDIKLPTEVNMANAQKRYAYVRGRRKSLSELEEAKKTIEKLEKEVEELKEEVERQCKFNIEYEDSNDMQVKEIFELDEKISTMFTREQVEKIWDAALRRKAYEDRMNYVPQTEDEYREAAYEASRELIQAPPPDKQTTINNLLNPGKDGK